MVDVLEPPREDPPEPAQAYTVSGFIASLAVADILPCGRHDDEIYEHTMREFPEFAEHHDKLVKLDEEWLKSKEGKERWRAFIAA